VPAAAAHVMDAQNLDFPSGSFDLVAASFVIHVLDDPAAGVAEAYRVLASGGQFAFTGGSTRRHARPGDGPAASEATSLGRRLNDLFVEFAVHLPPGASMGHLIDAAELLEDAGFVDLREKHATVAIPFEDNATLWRWAMSHGYRAFVEDLPYDRRREFHQRVMELPLDDRILRRETGIWFGRKPG